MPTTDYGDAKKRLDAVQNLFSGSSSTLDKLKSAGALVRGLSPRMDGFVAEYERRLGAVEKFAEGDILKLTAEQLPETTPEEKERKRLMLLFVKGVNDLKSEMARVRSELDNKPTQSGASSSGFPLMKVFSKAKGPLGLITAVAVVLVALDMSSVSVMIVNAGCNIIDARTSMPISLPGFHLPNSSIPPGGSAVATLPPLTLEVDGTKKGTLSFTSVSLSMSIELGSEIRDITMDGVSLIGKSTEVNLGAKKAHELRIVCGN